MGVMQTFAVSKTQGTDFKSSTAKIRSILLVIYYNNNNNNNYYYYYY